MTGSKRASAALVLVLGLLATRMTGLDVLLMTRSFIWAVLALSAWFLLRVSGRASLGNAAFFGVSAYVVGLCSVEWGIDNIWVALLGGIAASSVIGLVVGLVSGRLSGFHFLLITLAFAELLRSLALRWKFVGGEDGIAGITRPSAWPLPIELADSETMMWFSGATLLVLLGGVTVILRSPFGASVRAVRDSERRMASLSYSPVRYRVAAVVVASGIAGVAGVLNAYAVRFVSPMDLVPLTSAKALLFAAIGGVTVLGPIVVSVVMTFLEDDLSTRWDRWPSVLGLVYIAIAMAGPSPWRQARALVAARRAPHREPVAAVPPSATMEVA